MFAALKKIFPKAKITLVISPTYYDLFYSEINPYADDILIYKKGSLKNILKFYNKLREKKYEIGIVPSTVKISDTNHLINFLSGAKIRVGVKSINGKKNKAALLLNVKKDFNWKKTHQIERNLEIVNQIGCSLSEEETNSVKIEISAEDLDFADKFYKNNFPDNRVPVIAFHPGAGEIYRLWKTENFIELIKRIYDKYKCEYINNIRSNR